jgi:NAD(P)-dependent dehydrogenase (short-subunit alcohol dehydrogenase family)
MGSMTGKVAVVAGGATGLGAAVCARLAARGAAVAVNYSKSSDEAEATAAECRRLVADVLARGGRVDVLVNNAGPHEDGGARRSRGPRRRRRSCSSRTRAPST